MVQIKKTILEETQTDSLLSSVDLEVIEKLSSTTLEWVSISTTLEYLGCTKEFLLDWFRRQSTNKISCVGNRRVGGYTVVKAWMYDPNKSTIFYAFSPFLYEGDQQHFFD